MLYRVGLRVTVDATFCVHASSEEEAERKADDATAHIDLLDGAFRHIESIDDFGIIDVSIDSVDPAVE